MKLDARQAAAFLRSPGAVRLALLYGEDEGQIREHTRELTRSVTGSLTDPFLVADLSRDTWSQIPAEMSALSMIGGRRVIVVHDATDAVLPFVTAALAGPGQSLLIVEAPGLGRGKLRSYAEASPEAVALPSYVEDGAALSATISALLAERRLRADPDAIALLCQVLAGDRAVIRGEIEKLELFAEPGQTLNVDTVLACVGATGLGSGEDAIVAMTTGDLVKGDPALDAAFADGLNGIALLRMVLGHLQKLHQAKLQVQDGMTPNEAVRAIRPPVFYKNIAAMTKTLSLWPADQLLRVIEEARKTELACKQTGSIPDLLTRRYFYNLARMAQTRIAR